MIIARLLAIKIVLMDTVLLSQSVVSSLSEVVFDEGSVFIVVYCEGELLVFLYSLSSLGAVLFGYLTLILYQICTKSMHGCMHGCIHNNGID